MATSPFSYAGTATRATTQPTMKDTESCMAVLIMAPVTAIEKRFGSILIMSPMLRNPERRMFVSAAASVMGAPVVWCRAGSLAVRQASGRLQSCLAAPTVANRFRSERSRCGGVPGLGRRPYARLSTTRHNPFGTYASPQSKLC
ncbi:hypothetical protein GCM10029992_58020 [Glycomyces albus]